MIKLAILFSLVLLYGCDDATNMLLSPPNQIRQIAAYAPENLSVTVQVNGGDVQQFSGGNWSVAVTGIVRGEENTIVVSWHESYLGNDLLLARQQQTFSVNNSASEFTVTSAYDSEGADFDCDNDGISNLVERRESTDPCSGQFQYEPDMVAVVAGCFDMGSPPEEVDREVDEGPQINVCVDAFEISRYEATFAEYDAFTTATSRTPADDFGVGRGEIPALVSWLDATAYAAWLSGITGKRYRLPTEAEWEYAARAGTSTPFSTGVRIEPGEANFDGRFRYNGSGFELLPYLRPVFVGQFETSSFGLFDMHGNVWEWTCSRYEVRYEGQEQTCVDGIAGTRVARGGSWFNPPKFLRSAKRNDTSPDFKGPGNGFRVMREID